MTERNRFFRLSRISAERSGMSGRRISASLTLLCGLVAAGVMPAQASQAGKVMSRTMMAAPPSASGEQAGRQDVSARLLKAVNAFRAKNSLPPLRINPVLSRAAQNYANALLQRGKLDHTAPDGSGPADRAAKLGYSWELFAENLAYGPKSPEQVVSLWINSPGHRNNMLLAEATEAGIGFASGGSGGTLLRGRHYWTLSVARPARRMGDTRDSGVSQVITAVNELRRTHGLPPLSPSEGLNRVAGAHANDMAQNGFLGVRGSDGQTTLARVRRILRQNPASVRENVAVDARGGDSLIRLWLSKAGSRATLLQPDARFVGAAVQEVEGKQGRNRLRRYWSLVTMVPRSSGS